MPTASIRRALSLDLALRPYELMAAWRPESRNLVLVVAEPVAPRQPVQARITLLGTGAGATIIGCAARARPHPCGVELELEPDALRARTLERLVEVASGAPVAYRTRAPRYLAEIPALVQRPDGARRATTFAVSEGGCGLEWSGTMPAVGTPLDVQLGAAPQVASFCAEVCWTAPRERVPTLGLRFVAGDRASWSRIISALKAAGAPPA
jgi:hypothetical protein